MPQVSVRGPSRKGRLYGQLYPWDRWFGGGEFRARRGRDYTCRTDTFIQQVRNAARYYSVSVSIRVSDDGTSVAVAVRPRAPKPLRGRKGA